MKIRALAVASLFVLSAAAIRASTMVENFAVNPSLQGWQAYGDASLFQWNSTNGTLAVTWDSSQTNSYFYRPLGRTLTKADGFCVQFELTLNDATATGFFEIAIGLCRLADITSPQFSRANVNSPNLVEFDYYPTGPNSYGPSIDATLIDQHSLFYFAYDATQALAAGTTYHILLIHPAGASTVRGVVMANGEVVTTLPDVYAGGADDFSLDTLSINNYTTTDDIYGDSLLAHGAVDNLVIASPLPVDKITAIGPGQVQFASDTNWIYTLEATADFKTWSVASPGISGNGTNLVLQDTNALPEHANYRVRAELP